MFSENKIPHRASARVSTQRGFRGTRARDNARSGASYFARSIALRSRAAYMAVVLVDDLNMRVRARAPSKHQP